MKETEIIIDAETYKVSYTLDEITGYAPERFDLQSMEISEAGKEDICSQLQDGLISGDFSFTIKSNQQRFKTVPYLNETVYGTWSLTTQSY